MRVFVTIPAAFLLAAMVQAPASAEEDCIKDVTGRTVCGADAEAVRVRMRFEEQFRRDGDATPAVESGPVTRPATTTTNVSAGMTTMDAKDALADDVLQTRQIDQPSQQELVFTAQADCIENAAGQTVCGAEAEAVRARIEAEEAYKNGAGDSYQRKASKRTRSGSVYSSYGQKVFVRGGYSFAGHGAGAFSETGPIIAAGYGRPIDLFGDSVSIEGEIVYVSNSDTVDILGIPVQNDLWGLTGLVSLRWQPAGNIAPFASLGVGPAYYSTEVTGGGLDASGSDLFLGYSARAGAVASIGDQFSLEAGYRYLGAALNGTIGYHAAEVGVNYEF